VLPSRRLLARELDPALELAGRKAPNDLDGRKVRKEHLTPPTIIAGDGRPIFRLRGLTQAQRVFKRRYHVHHPTSVTR
jgi:hypothetical protein